MFVGAVQVTVAVVKPVTDTDTAVGALVTSGVVITFDAAISLEGADVPRAFVAVTANV